MNLDQAWHDPENEPRLREMILERDPPLTPARARKIRHAVDSGVSLAQIENHVRKWAIIHTLNACGGHHSKAAARLGVHRNTLGRMCADLGIERRSDGRWTNGGKSRRLG